MLQITQILAQFKRIQRLINKQAKPQRHPKKSKQLRIVQHKQERHPKILFKTILFTYN